MAETRVGKVEPTRRKIRSVPIAVTPDGFWCCPYPVMFQKNLKADNHDPPHKVKPSSPSRKSSSKEREHSNPSRPLLDLVDQNNSALEADNHAAFILSDRIPRPKQGNLPRKVSIEFGAPGTSDMKVVLLGKPGFCVKLCVHRNVLAANSSFFANKLSQGDCNPSCLEIDDCEDVELYVETVGLMYCKEMKQRLMKQSVLRVLRILKVAEFIGFNKCIQSCLKYLEAVPWVGEEEEKLVVSSVLRLQNNEGVRVKPVLNRVCSGSAGLPTQTLFHIIELVLKSNEDKSRNEMKSVVLKLLRENSGDANSAVSPDMLNETVYASCHVCLLTLAETFRQASDAESSDRLPNIKDPVAKQITLESDNISWLLDILLDRQMADEFSVLWADQQELAAMHAKVSVVARYHVSYITARIFVGIGRGALLPSKDTRHLLLQTWLQPLINDFCWLQNGCRSFDKKVVEEGIGRTILTLPLESQQSIFLSWMGSFLKAGDKCPNLHAAFEVWWRRTFVRTAVETTSSRQTTDSPRIHGHES